MLACKLACSHRDVLQPRACRLCTNSLVLAMPRRGGVKRKLQAESDSDEDAPHLVDSDDDDDAPKAASKGVRARISSGARASSGGASSSSSVPCLQGGAKQFLANTEMQEFDDLKKLLDVASDLPLNSALKQKWASGEMKSPVVQEIASAASTQGAVGLGKLPGVGSSGTQLGNIYRDLCTTFGIPTGSDAIKYVHLPTAQGTSTIPVLLPHIFFRNLYQQKPEEFRKRLLGGHEDLQEFWNSTSGQKLAGAHPDLRGRRKRLLYKTIPLGMHGDGGEFSHQDSIYVISWNSLLGLGDTSNRRFIFALLKKSQLRSDGETWNALWRIFSWSMNALLEGTMPCTDWLNQPIKGGDKIADNYSAVLLQLRGDWAWYCEILGFPKHNEIENMCWICGASINHPRRLYTDARDDAGWRSTLRTTQSWAKELLAKGKSLPVLFQLVRGLLLEHVMIDVLHTVDQGVTAHILGSIMHECSDSMGSNKDERAKGLHADLKGWYKKQGPAIYKIKGKITPERLKSGSGFSKFKGKAAETRHLSAYAVNLAERFHDGSEHSSRRLAVAQLLDRFYVILKSNGMFLPSDAINEIASIGKNLVILYNALSTESAANQVKTWKFTPKFHLWIHLCEIQAALFNPRCFWTYSDEDLVGQIIEVAQTCHPSSVAATAIYKYLLIHFD